MIPTNQNLYIIDQRNGNLDETSSINLAPHAGALAIDNFSDLPGDGMLADIFIVRWNPAKSEFKARDIPDALGADDKGLTFSPVTLLSK